MRQERASCRIFRKTTELGIEIVESSIRKKQLESIHCENMHEEGRQDQSQP
jgi:hypothetical protein